MPYTRPSPTMLKRKRKCKEELVEKDGGFMYTDGGRVRRKRSKNENSELFSKSYWEEQYKQPDHLDLGVESFICWRKVKRVEIVNCTSVPVGGSISPYYYFCKGLNYVGDAVDAVAQEAIHKYNHYNGEGYEFERVLDVNARPCAGKVYYITFRAKNTKATTDVCDAPSERFETEAYCGITKTEVHFCRPELKAL